MPSQLSQSATAGTAQRARLISLAAATIGVLLCVLVPLLPVRQSTVDINWPQGAGADGNISSVTAPLVSGAPLSFEAHIPCTAVATLPASGGVVLSTSPDGGFEASRHALFVRATTDLVVVAFRDNVATVAPRKAVESGGCTTLDIWANAGGVGANFAGLPNASGTLSIENKPQVTGLFTDLKVPAAGGPTAHVVVDTRFISSPTTLKLAAMVLGIGAVAIAIAALAVLERGGRKLPRKPFRLPGRAALLTNGVADIGVVGTLLLWHVIGAITSDDGNVLVEARVAHQAGYVAEYYRYFGATASPFDWYATLLSWLTQVSTAGVWMRVPATLAGIGTWYVLRKKMLPRLGEQLAASRTAVWTAALVFLTAWLPFNNGLRPEPIIVFGTVLTWILVERAIATRRLSPAALAIVVALLAATVAPQGLIALGPLLAGGRAIARVVAVRRLRYGRFTPIAVLAASVAGVLAFTFRDQTLATVAESARIKYVVGPTI
ncbi:arabinosyltransferase domain-containing protein, partial [Mycobacteroides abscessus]